MRKRTRYDLDYRIHMWFYRLTFEDVFKVVKMIVMFIGEVIIGLALFAALTIFPAFFH